MYRHNNLTSVERAILILIGYFFFFHQKGFWWNNITNGSCEKVRIDSCVCRVLAPIEKRAKQEEVKRQIESTRIHRGWTSLCNFYSSRRLYTRPSQKHFPSEGVDRAPQQKWWLPDRWVYICLRCSSFSLISFLFSLWLTHKNGVVLVLETGVKRWCKLALNIAQRVLRSFYTNEGWKQKSWQRGIFLPATHKKKQLSPPSFSVCLIFSFLPRVFPRQQP